MSVRVDIEDVAVVGGAIFVAAIVGQHYLAPILPIGDSREQNPHHKAGMSSRLFTNDSFRLWS
jgi:hypothetical protein